VTATHIARRLDLLRCPATGEPLEERDGALISVRSGRRYELGTNGVPLFAGEWMSDDARVQEAHYDRIASTPREPTGHTRIWHFDRALDQISGPLDTIIEVCRGAG
jgi:hypothetical protein